MSSLVLPERNKMMFMTTSEKLEVWIYPLEAAKEVALRWVSDNEEIATVSADGLITAHSAGETVIRVLCGEVFAECNLTVLPLKFENMEFISAGVVFEGDVFGNGNNSVIIKLLDQGSDFDEKGNLRGDGYFLNLNLMVENGKNELPTGTFKADTTGAAGTILRGEPESGKRFFPGSYFGKLQPDGIAAIFFKQGELKIAKTSAEEYEFRLEAVGRNGEIVSGSYAGKLHTFEPEKKNLVEKTLSFSSARAKEIGAKSGFKQIELTLFAPTDSIKLLLNTALGASGKIPVGTYEISSAEEVFAIEKGQLLGSTAVGFEAGRLSVAQEGESYALSFAFEAGITLFSGEFSGKISF